MTKRFERKERKGIHFTDRDQRVVKAVFYARYLTNQQICRLFYAPTTFNWCKQRSRYLYDKGYLRKRQTYPNEPDIYYLGVRGRHYITNEVEGFAKEQVDKIAGVGGEVEAPMLMMNHELTLSYLYVSLVLQCRLHGWDYSWQNARMLELRNLGVQPDAYLKVTTPTSQERAFIEFTGVLPTRPEMDKKLEGYKVLEEQMQGIPLLWLTTSAAKQSAIKRAIKDWIYKDYVLVGLIEDTSAFLTKPIWQWKEKEDKVPFIKSSEEVQFQAEGRTAPASQPVNGVE